MAPLPKTSMVCSGGPRRCILREHPKGFYGLQKYSNIKKSSKFFSFLRLQGCTPNRHPIHSFSPAFSFLVAVFNQSKTSSSSEKKIFQPFSYIYTSPPICFVLISLDFHFNHNFFSIAFYAKSSLSTSFFRKSEKPRSYFLPFRSVFILFSTFSAFGSLLFLAYLEFHSFTFLLL